MAKESARETQKSVDDLDSYCHYQLTVVTNQLFLTSDKCITTFLTLDLKPIVTLRIKINITLQRFYSSYPLRRQTCKMKQKNKSNRNRKKIIQLQLSIKTADSKNERINCMIKGIQNGTLLLLAILLKGHGKFLFKNANYELCNLW